MGKEMSDYQMCHLTSMLTMTKVAWSLFDRYDK